MKWQLLSVPFIIPLMEQPYADMEQPISLAPSREIFTVARLNETARLVLEDGFPVSVWVEGELSNFARPASGHWYFSLKDASAQVRCAMFRQRAQGVRFRPDNGQQVLLRAKVSLYTGRGDFQIIVESMEQAGDGALRQAFELLKQKLAAEGLFDPAHKKPLPTFPRCIGVVTSASGAAIRDILSVVKRRFPAMPVIIYPTLVQGEGAAQQIAKAIATANTRRECDVLLIARGGGSLEDLWSFNEEVVARAIYASEIPTVSGVGHEIDFTIADFVADVRAPTPTAAAELVTPDQLEISQTLARIQQRLRQRVIENIKLKRHNLQWIEKRLTQQHPQVRLQQHAQRLDELEQRLRRAHKALLHHRASHLSTLIAALHQFAPDKQLAQLKSRRDYLSLRLMAALRQRLRDKQQQLAALTRTLDTVSPLATLARGYAVITRDADGSVLTEAQHAPPGSRITARLHHGLLFCDVVEVIAEVNAEIIPRAELK